MKAAACVLVALALVVSASAIPIFDQPLAKGGSNWVVLIAGSNTWGNYRHQADIYHAYQIVHKAGIPDDHIIVFHYDDIADNSENPHRGVVINSPTGDNVYPGVPKNYVGADVNAENFLNVLQGKAGSTSGKSTGGQLKSTSSDNVFIYFADHGGPGILGMPEGEAFLYADDLNNALKTMHSNNMYNKLTFYVEACESGSIFASGALPSDINVYAVTAANPDESSWGCYCPGQNPGPPSEYDTCLGDLFSVTWLQNTDSVGSSQTLETQYQTVKQITSQNGTYDQGSHVMQYGDTSFTSDKLSAFIGSVAPASMDVSKMNIMNNWDAELAPLMKKPEALQAALLERAVVEEKFKGVVREIMGGNEKGLELSREVSDWKCYKGAIESFKRDCGPIAQHAFKHLHYLVSLCNQGVPLAKIDAAIEKVCHH